MAFEVVEFRRRVPLVPFVDSEYLITADPMPPKTKPL